jgi:3',5'-cyclic-nucleotide phosphodiesterase
VYALASVNAALVETYFNWQAWPNFTDRGKPPQLKKFPLTDLAPGTATPLQGTRMSVTAYPLSHGGIESTAFVVESDGDIVVYFGDTGPDPVEKTTRMRDVWAAIADRVKQRKLKAILIESSYTSDRSDAQLFGHLTPKWILQSLHELDGLAGGKALQGLPVVVTHIKYALTPEQPQARMQRELEAANDLGVRFVIPQQGTRWHFK